MYLVTSAQMRSIEERAMSDLQIPSLLLMENAALQTVKHVLEILGDFSKSAKIVVVCGPGNNGGDGFAIARLLHVKGIKVHVAFIGDMSQVKGDALINLQIVEKMGILMHAPLQSLLHSADLIVDALFGTGLRGAVSGKKAVEAIELMNASPAKLVSVDIASGVEADSGRVGSVAVRAHTTVTFGLAKVGHMMYPGTEYAGRVIVEDISIPQDLLVPEGPCLEMLDEVILPPRPARSNKGTFGRVCVLAGCSDMPGAAVLCSKAAYRAGAGLVHACVVPEVARVIRSNVHEVITTTVPEKNGAYFDFMSAKEAIALANVVALGPGIGRGKETQKFVREVIEFCGKENKPIVIDADAIMAIAVDRSMLRNVLVPCVITPHPGEMAALCGLSIQEVLNDLAGCAKSFSQEYGVVTLLKDARTIIAEPAGRKEARTFLNPSGTAALAKAGSGDVLTGLIASFIAQGFDSLLMSAVLGAYIHGKAGQLAAENLSLHGVTAGDVADCIAKALAHTQC